MRVYKTEAAASNHIEKAIDECTPGAAHSVVKIEAIYNIGFPGQLRGYALGIYEGRRLSFVGYY